MSTSTDMRRLHVALAIAGGPLSAGRLLQSGLWTPERLRALVEAAQAEGLVRVERVEGELRAEWIALERRSEVLRTAGGDLAALLERRPFPEEALAAARAAARERDYGRARLLYRALASVRDRTLLPGGEAGWLAAVVESIRPYRAVWGLSLAVLDEAIAVARSHQHLIAQAILLDARGLRSVWLDPAQADAFHRSAVEAAEAQGDPWLEREMRTHAALSLVLGGRIRDGIAAFEHVLGDLPEDLLEGPPTAIFDLDGPTPAWPIAVLAWAHANSGDHPRALDILHRMVARGAELGKPELRHQAELFLGFVHGLMGEVERARPYAEASVLHWRDPGAEPVYTWLATASLAVVQIAEGRLEEARDALVAALPLWRATDRFSPDCSLPYAVLESLERPDLPPLPGYELEDQIDRNLRSANPQLAGIAHRLRARRILARRGPPAREEAARHLGEAERLLRQSGGLRELHLALSDAADLADAMGRGDEGGRLRREAEEVARRMPAIRGGGSSGALRLASALLDLGKLGPLGIHREGLWGEVAARVCRDFGAERCALVEAGPEGLSMLAVRGGAPAWRERVLARLRTAPPSTPVFEPVWAGPDGAGRGQLVLVPFADEVHGRRGFVALENLYCAPTVGPSDEALVAALGRQVGILLANVGIWRELVAARQRLEQENRYYREEGPEARLAATAALAGHSRAMREVLDLVARVALSRTPVLVTGETGVGKELVAREIHARSRRDGPFIALHIAALAPGLAASALFGHERGAFTGATERRKGRFELADGGTILLDEVGELSLEDQVRLLRVLQEGSFERVGGTQVIRSDFRLVAATHRDLAAEVQAGRFRQDLYFRLAAFPIRVPPLRERREEIPLLAVHFMERASRQRGVRFERIGEDDLERLGAHAWPGNVRELEHVIERAALLSDPPLLRIPPLELGPAAAGAASDPEPQDWPTLEAVERRYIRRVLHQVRGRVNGAGGAAQVLGLKPSTLQYWLDKLDLREELARARQVAAGPGAGRR